jgi:hypothetical protein
VECALQEGLHSPHLVSVRQFIMATSAHVRPKQKAEVMEAATVKLK